jgi:hypothetical protein
VHHVGIGRRDETSRHIQLRGDAIGRALRDLWTLGEPDRPWRRRCEIRDRFLNRGGLGAAEEGSGLP